MAALHQGSRPNGQRLPPRFGCGTCRRTPSRALRSREPRRGDERPNHLLLMPVALLGAQINAF